jgi:hypothetical protein
MTDLYGHFSAMIFSFINLANRSRSNWNRVKIFKNLINVLSVSFNKHFLGFSKGVSWGLFPQVDETLSQFWPNNVPSMAQVLKNLDPNNACFFDSLNEGGSPNMFGSTETSQRKHQEGGQKDVKQLEKSSDV